MGEPGGRRRKIESELQRVLAELIARDVNDPRIGNVTITAVDVAPDMKSAKVYFVPFAAKHAVDEVLAGLRSASGFLRSEVGKRLGLRYTPRLDFVFDESIDRAAKLTELIDKSVKQEGRS
jgi:ribosome-binding factor A